MPLAAAWKAHYQGVDTRKLSLDEVVEAFPVKGKAFKVVRGGIACGSVCDVTYLIVPDDLSDGCLIHADSGDYSEPESEE